MGGRPDVCLCVNMRRGNFLARVRGIDDYRQQVFYVHAFGIMSDSYCSSSAILWHMAFGYKRTNFLFFVFVLKSFFVFIFRVLQSELEAVLTRW